MPWPRLGTLASSTVAALLMLAFGLAPTAAQSTQPSARLIPTTTLQFPRASDSNAPGIWELVAGVPRLFVLTSVSGQATRNSGPSVAQLAANGAVRFANHPGHGVWFEAVLPDTDGTWYGFYHQEWPADVCGESVRTIPRIGAARSDTLGATWEDLGIVLEAPPGTYDCSSSNRYFVGGVGDFSVALDRDGHYLYFFFSQYADRESVQGVSVARMAWADRDEPVGKAAVWFRGRAWFPARRMTTATDSTVYVYSGGMPIFRAADGWHNDATVDAYWGPSVHYNTYLERYVMLLNRALDSQWTQEGIYISFNDRLADPSGWSTPQRLLANGRWYPQVMGLEPGLGTDKIAGQRARFYMQGRSEYLIEFTK
jgi:hypothetical protein